MNLLGNAIKWTTTGFIEVSLSQARNRTDHKSALAHLSITDTGRGIAPDFLKHELFSPFSQEDSLSEGVGLGLSIVRKLVTFLGGHINMKSELGIGTQVDVYVPVQRVENSAFLESSAVTSMEEKQRAGSPLRACLIDLNGYPDVKDTPTGILPAEAKRKLSIQSLFSDILKTQLGWHVSLAESLETGHGDVAVIDETNFKGMDEQSLRDLPLKHGFRFFIVLTGPTPFQRECPSANIVYLSQPYVHKTLSTY